MSHPILLYLYLGIVCGLLVGCGHEEGIPRADTDTARRETMSDREPEPEITPIDSDAYSCRMLFAFPASIEQIRADPKRLIDGEDHCIFGVIDSLAARWTQSRDRHYLDALESVAAVSDGCSGEYLEDVSGDLFRGGPREYIGGLERYGGRGGLRELLVFFLRSRAEGYEFYHGERDSLIATTDSLLRVLPGSGRRFFREILDESEFPFTVDPGRADAAQVPEFMVVGTPRDTTTDIRKRMENFRERSARDYSLDTTLVCRGDSVEVRVTRYSLYDDGLAVPSDYYKGASSRPFVTDNSAVRLEVRRNGRVVLRRRFLKQDLLRGDDGDEQKARIRTYGTFIDPVFVKCEERSGGVSVTFPLFVPATDIGDGWIVEVGPDGRYTVN